MLFIWSYDFREISCTGEITTLNIYFVLFAPSILKKDKYR